MSELFTEGELCIIKGQIKKGWIYESEKRNTIVTRYRIKSRRRDFFTAALVSDLHDMDGEEALELLKLGKTDLIAGAGDFMERCDEKNGIFFREMELWQESPKGIGRCTK